MVLLLQSVRSGRYGSRVSKFLHAHTDNVGHVDAGRKRNDKARANNIYMTRKEGVQAGRDIFARKQSETSKAGK